MREDGREILERLNRSSGEAGKPRLERRYIFDGGQRTPVPSRQQAPHHTRKITRRRYSTFNTIALLFGFGLLIVLYVNNILAINQLAADVGKLQARYSAVQNLNASLRAEVNQKSSWERIGRIATDQLGLVFPQQPPVAFTIDESTLQRVINR